MPGLADHHLESISLEEPALDGPKLHLQVHGAQGLTFP